jgi:Domain of unknown function (DUF4136)
MRRLFCFPTLVLATGLFFSSLCTAADVKTYPGRDVDFAQFKTYQWLPTRVLGKAGIVEDEPTLGPLLRSAVNKQLLKLGLTESSGPADLQVAVFGLREADAHLEAVIFSFVGDAEWGTSPRFTVGRFTHKGALVVNLIDTKTKKSAWAGISKKGIRPTGVRPEDIEKAAANLFKKYPK